MAQISYLNGEFLPHEECKIPIDDRGLLFADALYEAWCSHNKVFFGSREHMARLRYGAEQIKLDIPWSDEEIIGVAEKLQEINGLTNTLVYLQISRGVAPRLHQFPKDSKPTIFMTARPAKFPSWEDRQKGIKCVTFPDLRWGRCDIKTVNLLPNVLARQAAAEKGCYEAILIRDGVAIEAAAANFYAVVDGKIHTYPKTPRILGGITRSFIFKFAKELGIPVVEEGISEAQIWTAQEMFISSVSIDVYPVTNVDGKVAGGGKMGPISLALYKKFHETNWGEPLRV